MIDTIIFDMDGVLFNSEKMYKEETIKFFEMYNKKVSDDYLHGMIGMDEKLFYDYFYEVWGTQTTRAEFEILYNKYESKLKRNYKIIMNEGLIEILQYLKSKNIKLAVASNSCLELVQYALEDANIKNYFECILSGEQFSEGKPNPEMYLCALKKLKSEKNNSLVVEDSTLGILAASRAGIKVLALQQKEFQLDQTKADYIIGSLLEIKQFVN